MSTLFSAIKVGFLNLSHRVVAAPLTRMRSDPNDAPSDRMVEFCGLEEIKGIVEEFRRGAQWAKAAGMDGVELHAANGYLTAQFLQDGSNKRADIYGGSVENRTRIVLEVVAALVSVWGGDRVGVRLSPSGQFGGMSDSNREATFG